MGSLTASIRCLMASIVISKTLTEPSSRGWIGWLPAPSSEAPSPSRNRLTTASAAASWSTGAAEADASGAAVGAVEWLAWSSLGKAEAGACGRALAAGGYVQLGTLAEGAHA